MYTSHWFSVTSPSDAARRSPRPRDVKTDPRRGEPMGEDIGERARGSPREARAKVGKPRRRIGVVVVPLATRVAALTRSAGAMRRADRAVTSMCDVDTGVREGRVDCRARFAGEV